MLSPRAEGQGEGGLEPGVFGKSHPGVLEAFPPSAASSGAGAAPGVTRAAQSKQPHGHPEVSLPVPLSPGQ